MYLLLSVIVAVFDISIRDCDDSIFKFSAIWNRAYFDTESGPNWIIENIADCGSNCSNSNSTNSETKYSISISHMNNPLMINSLGVLALAHFKDRVSFEKLHLNHNVEFFEGRSPLNLQKAGEVIFKKSRLITLLR